MSFWSLLVKADDFIFNWDANQRCRSCGLLRNHLYLDNRGYCYQCPLVRKK